VVITYYQDKSFTFEIKTPPASYLPEASGEDHVRLEAAGPRFAGTVTMDQCREIAKKKLKDLNTDDVDAGAKIIAGSARAMGLQVTGA
jgi:large subunit ribosomal protein L11